MKIKKKLIILRPYQINIINKILENVQIGENGLYSTSIWNR